MGINPVALYLDLERDLLDSAPAMGHYPGASVTSFACQSLLGSFFKKFEDWSSAGADVVAMNTFLASDFRCKEWKLETIDTIDDILIGGFKQAAREMFDKMSTDLGSWTNLSHEGRFGPGASNGALGTDFYTKSSSSPLTSTSLVIADEYVRYVSRFPTWREAEEIRSDAFGDVDIVQGSRLSFVPKNQDTSRCICIEPSLNMYFQLGLGKLIERRIRSHFGVDLSTQPDKNRELARMGSTTGLFSTIDLKSASDTISLQMVKQFLPPSCLYWIERLRSPFVELPDGSQHELSMVSSMGNGFTFPLQTALFLCVVSSVAALHQHKLVKPDHDILGNFGVFGDDIIVETKLFPHVCRLLGLLGFQVNEEKSFNDGWFRESCGGDFYRGHHVRGVYVKSLKTPQARVVVLNRLNRWSAITGVPLPRVCRRLMMSLKGLKAPMVPLYENDDAGIRVPFSMIQHLRRDKDTQSILYVRWVPKASGMKIIEGGIEHMKGMKQRIYNPAGFVLSMLHGSLENHTINVRLGVTLYGRRRAVSPNWDWLPVHGHETIEGWRLEHAIRQNMCSDEPRR